MEAVVKEKEVCSALQETHCLCEQISMSAVCRNMPVRTVFEQLKDLHIDGLDAVQRFDDGL